MSVSLTQEAVNLINTSGYGGLALGLIVDSAGVPIPSEVLIPLATVAALEGRFNLVAIVVIATIAQVVGGYVAYEIGRRGGLPLIERYGKYVLISHKDLRHTHRQFERRGELLALLGRCLPVIRGYVGFVAGIAEMKPGRFLIATAAGSFLWTLVLTAAGWLLADNVEVIDQALKPFSYAIIAVLALAAAWFVVRRSRSGRKETA